jgi:hypothetical protein
VKDTSCRKCKAPMPLILPVTNGVFVGRQFTVTGYRCKNCGHWNDLKRRKDKPEAGKP